MATYYTVLNDQFTGTSLNSNFYNTSGYTAGITVSGGTLNLETSTTLNEFTHVNVNTTAVDGTPLSPLQASTQVIAETKLALNAQKSASNAAYAVYFGIQDSSGNYLEFQAYTSSGSGTSTVYTLITASYHSSTYLTNPITTFAYGSTIYLRVSIDSSGTPTYQYSTDGSTWTTASPPSGYIPFSSNAGTYPYVVCDNYNVAGPQYTFPFDYLTFQTTEPPYVSFTTSAITGVAPFTVNFTDTSPGVFTAWSWNFGDGNTSTSQNPAHTYNSAGTYTVALTATDYVGTNTQTSSNLIYVGPGVTGVSSISNISNIVC